LFRDGAESDKKQVTNRTSTHFRTTQGRHWGIFTDDAIIRVNPQNLRFRNMRQPICHLLALLTLFTASACYEDNIACLDLDATNYDILADQACPDCCVFPGFNIDVARVWADSAYSLSDTLPDEAGNNFRLLRFRVYLTELELGAGDEVLPTPENPVELSIIAGADTVETELNANLALLQSSGATTALVGRLRAGTAALTQVRGRIGMSNDFPAVYPFSAPAASPLSTQVGRLNFNDGAGYLTASAEYILTDTNDTVRVDVRGDRLFELDFGQPVPPLRGVNLTVEIAANYKDIFGAANLTADEASVADAILAGLENWLVITGIR